MFKIKTTYIANGKPVEDKFKLNDLIFNTPMEAAEKIAEVFKDVEKNDPYFKDFRSRLNDNRINYLFNWDGDYEDIDAVASDMTFGTSMLGESHWLKLRLDIYPI